MPVDEYGGWVQAHNEHGRGYKLHPLNPLPGEIRILTAARALSYMCRFSGNLCTGTRSVWHKLRPGPHENNIPGRRIYSVAQHSVIVSYCVPPEYQLEGLLHDLTEGCGLPDVPYPVKRFMPEYNNHEAAIYSAIVRDYRMPEHLPSIVEYWDKRMIATERRDLLGAHPGVAWQSDHFEPLPLRIIPLNPYAAYAAFRRRFLELTWGRRTDMTVHKHVPDVSPARQYYNRARYACGLRYMFTGVELAGLPAFAAQQKEAAACGKLT